MTRSLRILGVPTSQGCLFNGTETTPAMLRSKGLVEQLKRLKCFSEVMDLGDVLLPELSVRHNVPPIRHWPGPRMVWEHVSATLQNEFASTGSDARWLVLGGDCSIGVATLGEFARRHGEKAFIIYLDAHMDFEEPRSDRVLGAAGFPLWLLTHQNPFWTPPELRPQQILVVGNQIDPGHSERLPNLPLAKIREQGLETTVREILNLIPSDSCVAVHFDVDVLDPSVCPHAYSPSKTGLHSAQAKEILGGLLRDRRFEFLEVTELDAHKDAEGNATEAVIDVLVSSWMAEL